MSLSPHIQVLHGTEAKLSNKHNEASVEKESFGAGLPCSQQAAQPSRNGREDGVGMSSGDSLCWHQERCH